MSDGAQKSGKKEPKSRNITTNTPKNIDLAKNKKHQYKTDNY